MAALRGRLLDSSSASLALRLPRTATILPVALFPANTATAVTLTLRTDKPIGFTSAVPQVRLAALIFEAIR